MSFLGGDVDLEGRKGGETKNSMVERELEHTYIDLERLVRFILVFLVKLEKPKLFFCHVHWFMPLYCIFLACTIE